MSFGENLENLSIDRKNRNIEDPVAKAIRGGKAPTIRDVKMSVKVLFSFIIYWPGVSPPFLLYLGFVKDFNACYASYGDPA